MSLSSYLRFAHGEAPTLSPNSRVPARFFPALVHFRVGEGAAFGEPKELAGKRIACRNTR